MLYVTMMFASIYPVAITMRSSNVYKERSLGIYADNLHKPLDNSNTIRKSKLYFIREQLQRQLGERFSVCYRRSHFNCSGETADFYNDPITFSIFNIVFEVFSAYGCVGLSIS